MRLEQTLEDFKDIKGVYVNAGKAISSMRIPILDLTDEETEMYHKILKSVAAEGKRSLELSLGKPFDTEELIGAIINNLKIEQNYCVIYASGVWETEEEQMDDEDSTIVALLHDVVEDTNYALYEKDFSNGIIASVNHDGDRLDMDE